MRRTGIEPIHTGRIDLCIRRALSLSIALSAVLLGVCHTASGNQILPPFEAGEITQYLFIGTGDDSSGDAINLQKTEFGADQIFVSDPDPNLVSVFVDTNRWSSATNRTTGSVPASAPVFEGIDYSGNMAITSSTGGFTMSDSDVYANEYAVRCASPDGTSSGECRDNFSSPSGSPWFSPTTPPDGGPPVNEGDIGNGNGVVGSFDHSDLITELEDAWTFINTRTAEATINANLENGSSTFNIDAADTNMDGYAVIDIDVGDNDFELNNYDWILDGTGDVFGIFRVRGDTNMLMSNSSIALGPGGIGNGSASDAPDRLGAIFVQYEEPEDNTDSVFSFSNFILNGVGIWDLNAFQDGSYDDSRDTEVNLQNGQGCSQFISSSITHTSSGRWNFCHTAPEPSSLLLGVLGCTGLLVIRRRGHQM